MAVKDEILLRYRGMTDLIRRGRDRLEAREEANFLRQLSLMIDSGISFIDALNVLQTTMEGRGSALAQELGEVVHAGHSLSRAFHRSREKVSSVSPPLIEAGEASGGLSHTLRMAADWAELAAHVRAKLQSALIYPAFIIGVNCALTVVMLLYVLPTFVPLFAGESLPLLTRFFVALSQLLSSKLFWIVLALATMESVFLISQPGYGVKAMRVCLRLPVVGKLLRSAACTKYCAVLAVTSRTGVPITQALTLAAKASGDPDFQRLDTELQKAVRAGVPLADFFLANIKTYGMLLSHGMALSQETGSTDSVCARLTTHFKDETEVRVQQFRSLIEPLLLTLVSLTTATLLLAIYLPLGRFLETLLG